MSTSFNNLLLQTFSISATTLILLQFLQIYQISRYRFPTNQAFLRFKGTLVVLAKALQHSSPENIFITSYPLNTGQGTLKTMKEIDGKTSTNWYSLLSNSTKIHRFSNFQTLITVLYFPKNCKIFFSSTLHPFMIIFKKK